MSGGSVRLLRSVLGGGYLLAGVVKFVPVGESTVEVIDRAVLANRGTRLDRFTTTLRRRHRAVNTAVGAGMLGIGAGMLAGDPATVRTCALSSLPMLSGFALVLRRAHPPVILIDAGFAAAALVLAARAADRPSAAEPSRPAA